MSCCPFCARIEQMDFDQSYNVVRFEQMDFDQLTHALAYLLGGLFALAVVKLDGWALLLAAVAIWGALGAVLHLAQRQRLAALLQTRTAAYIRGWTESRQETTPEENR